MSDNSSGAMGTVSATLKVGRMMVPIFLMLSLGCSRIPSDAKLKKIFYANRDDFSRLVRMSEQDVRVVRINFDFTNMDSDSGLKKNMGLSPERWQEYRVLFRKLGLTDGLERREGIQPAVMFYVQCEGSAIDADCKGVAYSDKPIAPT